MKRLSVTKVTILVLSVLILISGFLISCGYRFGTADLQINEVQAHSNCSFNIEIRNKTFVPGLEDRWRYILSDELIRRGCNGVNNITETQFQIKGSIEEIALNIVAERSNQIALYEVLLKAAFTLTMPDGSIKRGHLSSPFITDFRSGSKIEEILVARDREFDRVLRDISLELIQLISRPYLVR